MMNEHPNLTLFNTITNQLSSMGDSFSLFEVFKKELTDLLNKFIDSQNAVKQELFIARNTLVDTNKKVMKLENAIDDLKEKQQLNQQPSTQYSQSLQEPAHHSSSSCKSTTPQASTQPPRQTSSPKILFIGDSITSSADLSLISDVTQSKIVTARAYCAKYDNETNEAKGPAHYPQKNFLNVVPTEAIKDTFDHLIIQAGATDITNLKTNVNPEKNIEYYKQETVISAKNTFSSAVLALQHQPSLKSVLIMKQTPRYDPLDVDPLSLKPALSQLFNNTLVEEWMSYPQKERIFVGSHNIDCSGAVQAARYRHTQSGRFDGVHLYGTTGSKAYTQSMLNIMQSASLISKDDLYHATCPQTRHQRSKRMSGYQGN